MTSCSIHILFSFASGPAGGGNQFLKALRDYLRDIGAYEDDCLKADIVLFNSNKGSIYELLFRVLKLRCNNRQTFINRIDGPIYLSRNPAFRYLDDAIIEADAMLFDGAIMQSAWSLEQMKKLGYQRTANIHVIHNSPNPSIFYPPTQPRSREPGSRTRIISTSWSANPSKGFSIYRFLDECLDVDRYSMTFVGNSCVRFKNIRQIPPLPSDQLAKQLRGHDLFLTASTSDACSNSLVEALHCGLPAVGINSGGNPELIKAGGELFKTQRDLVSAIESVAENLDYYRSKIDVRDIYQTGKMYYDFMCQVHRSAAMQRRRYRGVSLWLRCMALIARTKAIRTYHLFGERAQVILSRCARAHSLSLLS